MPHFYRENFTYFITYRLKNTIPLRVLQELRNRKEFYREFKTKTDKYNNYQKFFEKYDKILDNNIRIQHLKNPNIAQIVKNSLHFYDKKEYDLICYTIMPNHVHLVFHLLSVPQIGKSVLQGINVQKVKSALLVCYNNLK